MDEFKGEKKRLFRSRRIKRDTKRVFLKKGTCSRTFFYLLNREFGHPMNDEEQAADPLAGGIFQQGYQCGMLWGASLALGAESFRRTGKLNQSIHMAIQATRHVMTSFVERAKSPDCLEITDTDWGSKWSIVKYMARGKMFKCFGLADHWAPEAFEAAAEGLSLKPAGQPENPISCASEVVRKMGGSEEEMAIVAGLAGGLGLSGYGCGAMGAAIWKNTLERVRRGEYKYSLSDPLLEQILLTFYTETGYEMECRKICGKTFTTVEEHSKFLENGGCEKLIHVLATACSV